MNRSLYLVSLSRLLHGYSPKLQFFIMSKPRTRSTTQTDDEYPAFWKCEARRGFGLVCGFENGFKHRPISCGRCWKERPADGGVGCEEEASDDEEDGIKTYTAIISESYTINAVAPIRIADIGGWTDTWFAGHGVVCNIAVSPCVDVRGDD